MNDVSAARFTIVIDDGGFVPFIIVLAVLVLAVASLWKVFTKAGRSGWAALVPVYNLVVLMGIAGKAWWALVFFIPMANIVAVFIACISLARRFGKGTGFGVGLALLPFIFFPILAFGDARYLGAEAGDVRPSKKPAMVAIGLVASVFLSPPVLGTVATPAFMR